MIAGVLICWGGISQAFALGVTMQPTDQSVSLGAKVTHQVSATSTAPPLAYQWRFNDTEIVLATNRTLILTNVQLTHAGGYSVVVTDASGSTNSRVAMLDVTRRSR